MAETTVVRLGEHSPITSPHLPHFDSTGYLSVGELSGGDDDDSREEPQYSNQPRDLASEFFFHPFDQASSSSEAPATLNDSIQNRLLSRAGRSRYMAVSLNDTSKIEENTHEKPFQSDTRLFNFPALNAQPVRIIPSDLTIVSEILSTSPPATLSRSKKIKNPSLSGDWYFVCLCSRPEYDFSSLLF